jgi:hypothetical protein
MEIAMTLKPGTRIETRGTPACGGFPAVQPEPGIIRKPRRESLPLPGPGWYVVHLSPDQPLYPRGIGARLCMHESSFRVISNR